MLGAPRCGRIRATRLWSSGRAESYVTLRLLPGRIQESVFVSEMFVFDQEQAEAQTLLRSWSGQRMRAGEEGLNGRTPLRFSGHPLKLLSRSTSLQFCYFNCIVRPFERQAVNCCSRGPADQPTVFFVWRLAAVAELRFRLQVLFCCVRWSFVIYGAPQGLNCSHEAQKVKSVVATIANQRISSEWWQVKRGKGHLAWKIIDFS